MNRRAYYSARVADFTNHSDAHVIGQISQQHRLDVVAEQTRAWKAQCEIIRPVLAALASPSDAVFFEFGIPRMGKRADVVLVVDGIVFVLEFKVGASQFHSQDLKQAEDYALDLKHFHAGSHKALVIPVLVATDARDSLEPQRLTVDDDGLAKVLRATSQSLQCLVERCITGGLQEQHLQLGPVDDGFAWASTGYKPTPTIVQAAQALYRGHDVKEISRSDAGAQNLTATASAIAEVIERSKREGIKSICFVTGVPGAGKTLAGLNIATERMNAHEDEHAVFLSGNGPLVAVLREALARDEAKRLGITKSEATRKASAFIQNIHHFRDDNLETSGAPPEKVAVFDEAQRAWDLENTSKFMRTKKNQPGFNQSEPEFLINVMDRHDDWCVVIALIGGGQEINTGEAGLSEWFLAIRENFTDWEVHYSSHLSRSDYLDGRPLTDELRGVKAYEAPAMHLATSVRSFRAETLSDFVHSLLDNDVDLARKLYSELEDRYPMYVTRDLAIAKHWLKQKTRGSELSGVLASSGANRLRPTGLNIKAKIDPAVWFLNGPDDVRACQYLEEVATEFDVQGLELDWSCVAWDANLRRVPTQDGFSDWSYHRFSGTKWQNVNDQRKRVYLKNSYRVLLTRARQGMVIYVPEGDEDDPTRPAFYYDPTYQYLIDCGIRKLSDA